MQRFPTYGLLAQNIDRLLPELERLADDPGEVYSYIVSTVGLTLGGFHQYGSAPNFQGDCLTLCTCKHQMRSGVDLADWPGKWLAGLSRRADDGGHWLIFLARVESAYRSHADLWISLEGLVRAAKSACNSTLGDIYEPKRRYIRSHRFDPDHYRPPIAGHVHERDYQWIDDIDYRLKSIKLQANPIAPLLVCDRQATFLWQRPSICFTSTHHRDYHTWGSVAEFLNQLRSETYSGKMNVAPLESRSHCVTLTQDLPAMERRQDSRPGVFWIQ
jgi:hypothetical protein